MKKNIFFITLLQIFGWVLLIWSDYVSEQHPYSDFLGIVVFTMPVISTIVYLLVEKKWLRLCVSKFKTHLTFVITWMAESVLLYFIYYVLEKNDKSIVYQNSGWEHMLNGIEYGLYVLFCFVITPVLVLLCDLIVFIFQKIKSKRG